MDLLLPVFQLFYFIAHFLVSLCQAVYYTLHDVYRVALALYLRLVRKYNPGSGVQVGAVSKLPSHPLLLLLPGQYSGHQLPQVAALLATLVRAGVRYLTAYDAAGKLRDQQHDLKSLLEAALPATEIRLVATPTEHQQYSKTEETASSFFAQQQQDLRLRLDTYSSCESHTASANTVDGGVTHSSVVLNVVSFESGTSDLMACVLKVARGGHVRAVTVDQLNMQLATRHFESSQKGCKRDQYLGVSDGQVTYPGQCILPQVKGDSEQLFSRDLSANSCACTGVLPDPDLVIVVGEYISSNGFPSWFLRLSEFVLAPDLHKLDSSSLTKILENYAKIEQRYGR